MAFRRPHPRQRRTCEEYKAELEEENYHLRSELQAEVDSNCQNEKQIRELERECVHCEQEIQTLNGEIERLENASKEEIAELKSEISSLKKQLYQAKKDIRDNEKHISSIESLELQTEVDSNCQNEKQIRELEHECVHCEHEIQTLNGEIERLENASKEEIAELKSEISSLKKQLYQAKENIRNNEKHISNIERNSPDLYNSDDNMATIAELVDAIDGFMDNRATVRDILIGQIKGTTRQIRIKNNNLQRDLREVRRARIQLQTDLGREQRRRYDAEAERDNEIIRRQNAEGAMGNVIGDLHLLQTNGQNQVNRMLDRIARKQTRIGVLIQEKFALQNGWIRTPIFYGYPGEDPEDWLRDMQRYIIASRINVAPGAGQAPEEKRHLD
ncbi:hypothetical protein RhiirA1_474235 [Rhizophagus irregularis]|uniref:Uncharacterized protein n=2 Tax=Rhizophagus irregularis TaxID=588596 RepID=A0A2N0QYZ9_9GLOM|nr:hypothetical protein RhiirA1_474235 [Rhizophagus irregularis]